MARPAHRRLHGVRGQTGEREVCCPACRSTYLNARLPADRSVFTDVVVGVVVSGEERHPTFGKHPGFYGLVREGDTSGAEERVSEPRPWLSPTITCRRGHRLKVPVGEALERLIDRTPDGEPIYLPKPDPPTPIRLRLEPIPRA